MNQTKKTTGRRKIEIKKLEKDSNKQVTFSKRRAGLFKKASELCILCNAEVAMIVFSPADKLFCFGQPKAEAVIARYLKGTEGLEPSAATWKGKSAAYYGERNREYEELVKVLELEKKELAEIQTLAKVWNRGDWWNENIDEMSGDQLVQFAMAIYELRRKAVERVDELMLRFAMLP